MRGFAGTETDVAEGRSRPGDEPPREGANLRELSCGVRE